MYAGEGGIVTSLGEGERLGVASSCLLKWQGTLVIDQVNSSTYHPKNSSCDESIMTGGCYAECKWIHYFVHTGQLLYCWTTYHSVSIILFTTWKSKETNEQKVWFLLWIYVNIFEIIIYFVFFLLSSIIRFLCRLLFTFKFIAFFFTL